jgi:hypothetical protein
MRDKQTAGKYKGQILTLRHGRGKKFTFNGRIFNLYLGETPPHSSLFH